MSTWRERFKVHPAADVFPMMSDEELAALGEDIKANGLQKPIVLWVPDGYREPGWNTAQIIDGRNRLEAMERAAINPANGDWNRVEVGGDPVAYVISANVHRRHLTKEQRAQMLAAEYFANIGEVSRGGRGKVNEAKAKVVAKAAEHGIGKRTAERAIANYEMATLHPNAPPKLRAAARRKQKRETLQHYHQLLARLPRTVEGARNFYLAVVSRHAVDINAELEAVVDGLQRIADQPESERLRKRAQ